MPHKAKMLFAGKGCLISNNSPEVNAVAPGVSGADNLGKKDILGMWAKLDPGVHRSLPSLPACTCYTRECFALNQYLVEQHPMNENTAAQPASPGGFLSHRSTNVPQRVSSVLTNASVHAKSV